MDVKTISGISGQKIIITGAASGMGSTITSYLVSLGATVILIDKDEKKLNEVYNELPIGLHHQMFIVDLIEQDDLSSIFDEMVLDGYKINGLVHCAGMAQVLPINMLTHQRIMKEMCLNYFSFIELVRQFSKSKHSDGGSIIGISSIAAEQPEQCQTNYAASKAAMDTAARALAPELAKKGIRINTILPGATNTPMAALSNGRDLETIISKQALGMAEPMDIAYACAFLLSDMSRMMTGRRLFLDGGRFR